MFLGTGNMMLERGQQVIELKGVDGPTLKKVISGTDAPLACMSRAYKRVF
jgi:hypothetical protein